MKTSKDIKDAARRKLNDLGGPDWSSRLSSAMTNDIMFRNALSGISDYRVRLDAVMQLALHMQPFSFEESLVIARTATRTLEQIAKETGPFNMAPSIACLDLLAGTDTLQNVLRRDQGSCEYFQMTHKDSGGEKPFYWPTDEAAFDFLHGIQDSTRPVAPTIKAQTLQCLRDYEAVRPKQGSDTKAMKLQELKLCFEYELVGRSVALLRRKHDVGLSVTSPARPASLHTASSNVIAFERPRRG